MLSMTERISFCGISLRIASSTWSQSAAVSSMRVPVGARRCSLNSPVSTAGKKILAEQRQQREGEDTNGQKADGEKFVVAHANFQHAVITVAQPLESMFEPLLHARENVGLFLRLAFGQQGVIGEQV